MNGPKPTVCPYGSWRSPLSADALVAGVVTLSGLGSDGSTLYWLEGRPEEGGRTVLVSCRDGTAEDLTPPPFNVRSRVHEYGGGAYTASNGEVFFVDFADQNLHRIDNEGTITRITDSTADIRFADFVHDPARNRLISVVEAHHPDREPENYIAAIDLASGALSPLLRGHDFYAAPRLSPDGSRLAFIAWDHPNMPWDGTVLALAQLTGDGRADTVHAIAGGAAESVQQPVWQSDDALLFISDANGFWNLYRYDASGIFCVLEDGAEYAAPPWVFDTRSYALVDDDHVIISRRSASGDELVLLNTRTTMGTPFTDPAAPWVSFASPLVLNGDLYFVGGYADRMPAIQKMPLKTGTAESLRDAGGPGIDPGCLSKATPLTFPTRDGGEAHGFVYLPANGACQAPDDEKPPLLVLSHGGPTAATGAGLNLTIQYYTSRGWAVLDVNYRGSSGYGRAYRNALMGQWGILDVEDCEDGVRYLVRSGQVDGDRVAIRGGSAGGYTTLAALTRTSTFKAGASHYGIGDLSALAADTHKFESRYLDGLLGDEAALVERSPIHHLDGFSCPVIFFQGSEDRVVPPNQSRAMRDALRSRGIPVAYLEFPGEGHGFRDADNIVRTVVSEYAFFCRVFAIEPADALPELTIDNQENLPSR